MCSKELRYCEDLQASRPGGPELGEMSKVFIFIQIQLINNPEMVYYYKLRGDIIHPQNPDGD